MNEAAIAEPLQHLARLELAPGCAALLWLGQSGFVLRGGGATVLVDAFLADHPGRLVPAPFRAGDGRGFDVIACTHDHLDHLDAESLPALADASTGARILVPEPIVPRVVELGIDAERVVGAQPGAAIDLGWVRVEAVPACHGDDPADAYGFGRELSGGLYRYLGYVFDLGGVRIYHAGDTIPYEGLEDRVRALRVDVALLPINGRDAAREAQGIVGNLDEVEAAEVATAIGAKAVTPMHYDMFAANPGSPARFVELLAGKDGAPAVIVPARGRAFVYARAEGAS